MLVRKAFYSNVSLHSGVPGHKHLWLFTLGFANLQKIKARGTSAALLAAYESVTPVPLENVLCHWLSRKLTNQQSWHDRNSRRRKKYTLGLSSSDFLVLKLTDTTTEGRTLVF